MLRSNSGFLLLTRVGFAARGILYLLIAWLAVRLGRAEDVNGALEYLNSGAGRFMLAVMTVGLAAYGVWRLADAAFDSHHHGSDAKGIVIRIAHAASGLIHLWLAWEAAELVFGDGSGSEGREAAEASAATAMDLPGGDFLLLAGVGVLAAIGAFQLVYAARRRFARHLAAPAQAKAWIVAAGIAGYAARGIVFLLVAWLTWRAWNAVSPAEAGGIGDALATLPESLRTVLAIGLGAFGAFSLVEARYRVLPDPHIKARVEKAATSLT